ncbi:aldo/keto reductase [Desulfotignum phosphitoxidans]|uniref:Tat pathway signal sequence domain-containing protein n=1 Tax=Desulfotignum phosphitoxidans DSM 13687 TaxID=1286635 RepID=S0G7V4_9BACT|nr:aldo/keto reductase [Desulfotignum phosphitoxidans]EMS81512.1 Tat pathway signal sequence domain-containing protein [Desulfotignum phosphitoxidans DSM 13687]
MFGDQKKFTRRDFLKKTAAAGFGSALLPLTNVPGADASSKASSAGIVPTRPFGKTGVDVSILSLGGVLDSNDLLIFRQALKSGVTYWDTADSYGWGKNEKAIGKYFTKFPGDREKVFLVTKAATSDPEELSEKLDRSLQRMNTSYVDMYFIHYVKNVKNELTGDVKTWAEKAKSQGKIKFFGFSTHKNMENSMQDAARLGWVDGIMMSYNYRLMVKDEMKKAVDTCVRAGIGLTAMKTQAVFTANFYASIGSETDDALNMTDNFLKKGYTAEQAKLRVVWENPHIASICSAMPNMAILKENIAAALNKTNLSDNDKKRLETYAHRTASGYCAGCADICENAVDPQLPICDILRYSMYLHGYGDQITAARLFRDLPADVKTNILKADYAEAEKWCPHNIQIGRILKEAIAELA